MLNGKCSIVSVDFDAVFARSRRIKCPVGYQDLGLVVGEVTVYILFTMLAGQPGSSQGNVAYALPFVG